MMKYLLLFLFSFILLFAKGEESCYTVQLKSFVIKNKSAYAFESYGYADSCKLFEFTKMNTVRCGCFESYSEAQEYLKELKPKYEQATIVTTYKKRFSKSTISPLSEPRESDDQELRLLYQVFSYSTDLENAYKTAKKAVRLYPDSLYWHQKLAEVAQWTDRREEAAEHYMYVYKRTNDKALEKKIFEYSLAAYQYETAAKLIEKRVKENSSEENVKNMVYIFDLLGKPLESAELLAEVYKKDPSRTWLLTQQLQIYLNMGELQRAGKVVKQIEKVGLNDLTTAYLVSRYYFLTRDLNASYAALNSVDKTKMDGNTSAYYMQVSDLAWYIQEYEEAGEASVKVDEANDARLVDYERITAVYKKKEPKRAMKASLDAYKKFGQKYLFYTYAYLALDKKMYQELLDVCDEIEEDKNSVVVNEALYWMVKAQVYSALKDYDEANIAYKKALALDANSKEIFSAYIWFLMDSQQSAQLEAFLFGLEEKESIDSSLYPVLAVAYFNLQNPDRSLYYVEKIKESGNADVDTEFIYAFIKQGQNEEGAYYKQIRSIYKKLDSQLKENPLLAKNSDFMLDYLTAKLPLVTVDEFDRALAEARAVLGEQSYNQLLLSRDFRENIDERVHNTSQRFIKLEAWLVMNMALRAYDKATVQETLHRYYRTLPMRDRVQAARLNYEISLAQSAAFEGLDKNRKDELSYDALRQLHNEHADYFLTRTGYLSRTGLNRVYSEVHNSYYLAKGYSFEADVFLASNSVEDDDVFREVPSTSTSIGFGIKKRFDRGFWELDIGRRDSADEYDYLSFTYNTVISERLSAQLLVDAGANADESVYTLVAGYKDRVSLETYYRLLGSSTINIQLEKSRFYSQDDVELGSGVSGRISYSYLQRSAYPDITVSPFYSFGDYSINGPDKGVIRDYLAFPDANVISDDFWYLGTDFNYGMENRFNYVRVWRPFFSVSPYYNGREEEFNMGASLGMGGELFGQDNLSFVVDYASSVGGTQDELLRTFFRYKILY